MIRADRRQTQGTEKGASRVPGDHNNDRHNRRRSDTKDLPRVGPRSRGSA
jgi:hypothetical protein